MERIRRFVLGLSLTAGIIVSAGCHAPPLTIRMDRTVHDAPPIAAGVELWDTDDDTPPLRGRRVAILECSLELITMKQETPTTRQAMVGGPVLPTSAIVDLAGVFRRRVDYPRDVAHRLPRRVLDGIVEALEVDGVDVLAPETVACCSAYCALERETVVRSSPIRQLEVRGSDAGRANQYRTYPASPLRVLTARLHDKDAPAAEHAVLDEVEADVAMCLRLRVGLYQGRVSIERGSVIALRTRESSARLVSERSVVSHQDVASVGELKVVKGRRYTVDWPAFERGVEAMVPPLHRRRLAAAREERVESRKERLLASLGLWIRVSNGS